MDKVYHKCIVVVTIFLCQVIYGMIFFAPPRMLVAMMETFRINRVQAGSISSANMLAMHCAGIVSGSIVHKYGTKVTCAVSTAVIGVAFCVCFFATSPIFLLIFAGIIAGAGLGILFISAAHAVYENVEGNMQTWAVSFVLVGTCVGGMAFSYITGIFLDSYGLRGTLLLLGAITCNAPVLTLLWSKAPMRIPVVNVDTNIRPDKNTRVIGKDQRVKTTLKASFIRIFTNGPFLLFVIGNSMTVAVNINASIYIMDNEGSSNDKQVQGSLTLFIYNLFILFGRLICGVLRRLPQFSPLDAPNVSSLSSVTGCLLLLLVNVSQVRQIAWGLVGFSFGLSSTSAAMTTEVLLGTEHVPTGIGTIFTTNGVGILLGGPLNGYIRDVTGSYRSVFLCSTVLLVLAGILLLASRTLRKRQSADRPNMSSVTHL